MLVLESPRSVTAGISTGLLILVTLSCGHVRAGPVLQRSTGWTELQTVRGLSASYPAGIFNLRAGPTERGVGQKFRSEDGRYEFSAYSLANPEHDTPRTYLQKNLLIPPASLVYRRVTARFFVMSSIREGNIFYSRCNFAEAIHCIFLEYPSSEKDAWDAIVTRISYSLRPR